MLKKEKKNAHPIEWGEEEKSKQKNCMKTFTFLISFFIPLVEVSRVYRAAPVETYVCIRCRAELTLPDHRNVTKKRRDCQKIKNSAERNSC